jgi:hypothetical protein
MQLLLALPISIAIILISVGFGRRFLSILRVETCSPVERSVFGMGLGFGTLSYLVLAAGLLRILYPITLAVILAVMAILSVKEMWGILAEIGGWFRSKARTRPSAGDASIVLGAVLLGVLALICALAPPSGSDWDGLSYHLAVPKIYLAHHAIHFIPFTSHSNFPFLTEMLYTVGLAFGSTGVAKLFHFAMYIGTGLGILSLGRRHLTPLAGKAGALIFLSAPVVFSEAGLAYADITMGFYILLATYAILNWEETRSRRWLTASAILCGFALGTKVLVAIPIVILCAWVLIVESRECGWRRGMQLSFLLGLGAIVVGSPWYIKSWIYTGNPVYPFMYNVFGGKLWTAQLAADYNREQTSFGMGKGLFQLFMLPWNLVANGIRFFNLPDAKHPNFFAMVGPSFVGLIPVAFLAGRLNKALIRISIMAVIFFVACFFLMQHSRYLIAVLPLFSLMAGVGVEAANRKFSFGKYVANGFVAFTVLLTIFFGFIIMGSVSGTLTGVTTAEEYLSDSLDVYDAESFINSELPQNARVVLFDETRGFYLNREYIWGNPQHHAMIPWSTFHNGAEMVDWFAKNGYTHFLVNWKFAGPDDLHKYIKAQTSSGNLMEVHSSHGVSVYELRNGKK